MTRDECAGRLARLQERLRQQDLSGALISHPIDLYYFTGTRQNGVLWTSASGETQLMVRKSLSRARAEALIDHVLPFPSSKEFAASLPEDAVRIGMTFDVLPVQQYNYYAKMLPDSQFADISAINRDLRSVKSAQELAVMRVGGEKLCSVFAQIPDFLRAGMREVDLAAEFRSEERRVGKECASMCRSRWSPYH